MTALVKARYCCTGCRSALACTEIKTHNIGPLHMLGSSRKLTKVQPIARKDGRINVLLHANQVPPGAD